MHRGGHTLPAPGASSVPYALTVARTYSSAKYFRLKCRNSSIASALMRPAHPKRPLASRVEALPVLAVCVQEARSLRSPMLVMC